MEVRFRPLRDSTLTRHVTPGQSPAEDGQNFLEVIENVAGAEQPLGENPNSDRDKEKPPRKDKDNAKRVSESGEDNAEDNQEALPHAQPEAAPKKNDPDDDKPLGTHIDMTV